MEILVTRPDRDSGRGYFLLMAAKLLHGFVLEKDTDSNFDPNPTSIQIREGRLGIEEAMGDAGEY